jgi:hypothetical protein
MVEELKGQAMTQMNFGLRGASKVDYKHNITLNYGPRCSKDATKF